MADETKRPDGVLSDAEWQEIADSAQALWAALECGRTYPNEFRDLVDAVSQRLQRAMAPINKRLSREHFEEKPD